VIGRDKKLKNKDNTRIEIRPLSFDPGVEVTEQGRLRISDFSPAAGLKSGRFNRKGNYAI
jgi:hypothetical protein